ncbi:lipoprotein [Klebsiella pneumoniae]|nr:hypothetical protein THOKLE017_37110 [Klebsiella pneumoniae]SWP30717.1 lipoprotein [Klebsiella pneumoniae]SWS83080.1 lipoprotein [Klebsiella pneumoniae]VAQ19213.1 lipoprotein [Klebsiella pneumoniae]
MRLSTAVLALSCALATITGCTSSKSSPERHAYAFVAHRSDFSAATSPSTARKITV